MLSSSPDRVEGPVVPGWSSAGNTYEISDVCGAGGLDKGCLIRASHGPWPRTRAYRCDPNIPDRGGRRPWSSVGGSVRRGGGSSGSARSGSRGPVPATSIKRVVRRARPVRGHRGKQSPRRPRWAAPCGVEATRRHRGGPVPAPARRATAGPPSPGRRSGRRPRSGHGSRSRGSFLGAVLGRRFHVHRFVLVVVSGRYPVFVVA